MAAALGQAPGAESAWLKSVPADVAVVVRVKALETARGDLMKMLEAMSGNAAALAGPQIEQGLQIMAAQYGKPATEHPFFTIMRLPKDGAPMPPWAVLVESNNYEAVLKSISKKDDLKPKSLGGYDSFDGPDGATWYSAKGAGFVAFGQDEALIKSVTKPEAALSEKISADLRNSLLGGDLGVYVNIAAIQTQYAEQIEQGRQMFMGLLDQAGAQMGGNMQESIKSMYGKMFDAIKVGDALAFSLDFAPEGFALSGLTTVKADSAATRRLAAAGAGSGEMLGKLPADSMAFAYMNMNPEAMEAMQRLGMSLVTGEPNPSPALQKALALQREAGITETYSASTGGMAAGMHNFTISLAKDPQKAFDALVQTAQAMKTGKGMVKDVVITPNALSHRGFKFTAAKTTFDLEKMVTPGAPGGVEGMKKMLGGSDTVTAYYGTDGKTVLTVTAKSPDDAKRIVDEALGGQNGIGKAPNFEAIRARFPKQVGTLILVNAQAMVKQMAAQLSATLGKADLQVPADLPKEPALFGGSITGSPKGFQFQFVVPSNVGPVIEKGFVPLIQGLQGQIQ